MSIIIKDILARMTYLLLKCFWIESHMKGSCLISIKLLAEYIFVVVAVVNSFVMLLLLILVTKLILIVLWVSSGICIKIVLFDKWFCNQHDHIISFRFLFKDIQSIQQNAKKEQNTERNKRGHKLKLSNEKKKIKTEIKCSLVFKSLKRKQKHKWNWYQSHS